MKRIKFIGLVICVILSSVIVSKAAPFTVDYPLKACADPTAVSISTSAWTQVPASQCAGRTVVVVANIAANNAAMGAYVEESTTASVAITITPIEIAVGSVLTIHLADTQYLFLVSLHTSAENADIQEFRQRK